MFYDLFYATEDVAFLVLFYYAIKVIFVLAVGITIVKVLVSFFGASVLFYVTFFFSSAHDSSGSSVVVLFFVDDSSVVVFLETGA